MNIPLQVTHTIHILTIHSIYLDNDIFRYISISASNFNCKSEQLPRRWSTRLLGSCRPNSQECSPFEENPRYSKVKDNIYIYNYLVVLTILKNISQWEGLSHILWKILKQKCLKPPTRLLGGWPTPLKNMSSSVGMIIPKYSQYMESHKKHVPVATNQIRIHRICQIYPQFGANPPKVREIGLVVLQIRRAWPSQKDGFRLEDSCCKSIKSYWHI